MLLSDFMWNRLGLLYIFEQTKIEKSLNKDRRCCFPNETHIYFCRNTALLHFFLKLICMDSCFFDQS